MNSTQNKDENDSEVLSKILGRYKLNRIIGHGAYGTVWAAHDRKTGKSVAIKKIGGRNFEQLMLTKRALREIKLLRHLMCCSNITELIDADTNSEDITLFNELYLVESLMEADLHQIIKSDQELTDQHCQYFIYQILRGLKWMHTANVVHRDLKPGNLLVNSNCHLRICDFGLGRGVLDGGSGVDNTEYVATRYYRAPEVILSPRNYSKELDMWSVGCILGELLTRKVLFKGYNYIDQLAKIFEVLGTPKDANLMKNCSSKVRRLINSWPKWEKVSLFKIIPTSDPNALKFLERTLILDPKCRMAAEEGLAHPYVLAYHQKGQEPSHPKIFNFEFELICTLNDVKEMIINEVACLKRDNRIIEETKQRECEALSHLESNIYMQDISDERSPRDVYGHKTYGTAEDPFTAASTLTIPLSSTPEEEYGEYGNMHNVPHFDRVIADGYDAIEGKQCSA